VEAAIQENIHHSARDVLAVSEMLRRSVEEGRLTVLEAEYQLKTGAVVRLQESGDSGPGWIRRQGILRNAG
jgi:hypothetical protein